MKKSVYIILTLILMLAFTLTFVDAGVGIQPPKSKGITIHYNTNNEAGVASSWTKSPKSYWDLEVQFKNCKTGKIKNAGAYGNYTAFKTFKKGKKSYKLKARARYTTRNKYGYLQGYSKWSSWSQTILIPKKGKR